MGLFSTTEFETLEDLFCHQIEDLYDAEIKLVNALPKMADAATNSQLKAAFHEHLQETQGHVKRLEQVFHEIGRKPERETCDAMKGLISEGEDMVKAKGNNNVRDAALIAAAQRVEHYEMAGYGTARSLAQHLGHEKAAQLLQETLEEERGADSKLTQIAVDHVNVQAASH